MIIAMGQLIKRKEWGARPARSSSPQAKSKTKGVVLHHTTGSNLGSADCAEWVRNIQRYHMDTNGWDDIGYHVLVCRHGDRYQGRPLGVLGAHVAGHNTANVGVCAMGDGRRADNVTDALLVGLDKAYEDARGWAGHKLTPRTHGQLAATACPGGVLTAWWDAGRPLAEDAETPTQPSKPAGIELPAKPVIMKRDVRPVIGSTLERETRRVQAELRYVHGFPEVGAVDGWCGPRTAQAVIRFQEHARAKLLDGIVGPETWRLLLR